ncbi:ABC transporter permease [Robinsoniella peoriensis]|uniref:ABC transporter permease n=1 Tax=Robinsoniella peoriensis TaxID=180332 RepID=UPI00085CBE74|nr:ABC transporter permease subunit [Robinsoniella peoriensis]
MKKKKQGVKLFLYILPFMLLLLVFSYYPLYGWIYAFFDYRPPIKLADTEFVGLFWFRSIFSSGTKIKQLLGVLRNTFAMSGLGILTSWMPMAFAIFLSELKSKKFNKLVQTLTTLPNFISWVLVFFMAFTMFSSSGVVNNLLVDNGLIDAPIQFLQSDNHVWLTMWLWATWKGLGWGSIMYLAAISGIDQSQYEAARVDGAGRFALIWHVTVPGLIPTYFVLLLLNVANFLNNGMEQYFMFQNNFNMDHIQVLDLYVYNLGMGSGSYSLATSFSVFKSLISIVLLFGVNRLSKKIRGESII